MRHIEGEPNLCGICCYKRFIDYIRFEGWEIEKLKKSRGVRVAPFINGIGRISPGYIYRGKVYFDYESDSWRILDDVEVLAKSLGLKPEKK